LVLGLTAILAIACYVPALEGRFISDDSVLVARNPAVRSLSRAAESFGGSFWEGLKEVAPYYRPLVILSYAADYSVAGPNPTFFHATNVLLHAANAVLAALLVLGLCRRAATQEQEPSARAAVSLAGALLAGALAACHPIHSEPVAAIYGRPDLLAAALALGCLNLAIRGHAVAAALCLAGSLFSKEAALGLPLLVPLALAIPRRRGRGGRSGEGEVFAARRRVWIGSALALLVALVYLALRYRALGFFTDPAAITRLDNPLASEPSGARWMTAISIVARYALLWLWPSRLCADRGFDTVAIVSSVADPGFLLGGAVILMALLLLAALFLSRSVWWLPVAASIITFLPASNLILLAPAQMAERFAYMPSMFICVLIGGAYARLTARPAGEKRGPAGWPFGRRGLAVAAAVLVSAFGFRTLARSFDFRDEISFFASGARSCPRSAKAQYNLGNALARSGLPEQALGPFQESVSLAPWLGIAHNNKGNAYLALRRLEEAAAEYRAAIEASPWLINPRASLAGIFYLDGRLEEALAETESALALNPGPADAAQLEGLARRIRGRLADSRPKSK
jgi:tetratricopeptide (TPR) repeat protein